MAEVTVTPSTGVSANPTLTPEFNAVEHIQSVCLNYVNKIVREDFSDVADDLEKTNLTNTRFSVKQACLHKDSDSLLLTVARLLTYYLVADKAKKLQAPLYATPTLDHQEDVSFRPAVWFYFEQHGYNVTPGLGPLQGRYSFRLVNESSDTINELKATTIAKEIKRIFAPNGVGYGFSKGKIRVTYLDKKRGYDFRFNVSSALEGELLVKRFLQIQDDPFIEDYFTDHTPKKQSINNPTTTRTVYGKKKKTKRWRPTGEIKFVYATLQIDGLAEDVMLVDTRDRLSNPLV